MRSLLAGYSRILPILAAIGHQYFAPFWPTGTAVAIWLSPFVASDSVRQWLPWLTSAWTGQLLHRALNKSLIHY
jgi:hypothetical protein